MKYRFLALGLLGIPLVVGVIGWQYSRIPAADPLGGVRDTIGTRSATPALEQLSQTYPRNAEVRFLRAQQARFAGQLDEAQTQLGEAERLGWNVQEIKREWTLQRARIDFSHTRAALERLLLSEPADSEVLLALGEGDFQLGHHKRAADFAERVLVLSPNNPRALHLRGATRLEARHLDAARNDLELAIAANPESFASRDARLTLARCLLDLGEFARARELFQEVRADEPTNLLALFGIGRTASYLGQFGEAEEAFIAVLKLRPGHVETLLGLAQVVEQRGDLSRALTYLETASKSEPKRLEILSRMVKLLAALGQSDRAAECAARYRELDPTQKPPASISKEMP